MAKLSIDGKTRELDLLIFDKDGTIVDFSCWVPVMLKRMEYLQKNLKLKDPSAVLASLGLKKSGDEHVIIKNGNVFASREKTLREVSLKLQNQGVEKELALRIAQEAFAYADREIRLEEMVHPVIGKIGDYFDSLYASGLKLAVATGDGYERTCRVLEQVGIKKYFEVILGRDSVREDKPDPEYVHKTMTYFGMTDSSRVAVIGDSICDIQLAGNTGAVSIAVLTGNHSEFQLASANPDFIIDDISEIRVIS